MSEKVRLTKPLLIMLYGLPGSGKSAFARQLTEYMDCAHVHSDRIRYELFEQPRHDKQENDIITHLMDYMTDEFLDAGVSVIYDANVMRKAQRLRLRDMARKKQANTLLVWLQIDADSAFDRLKNRDRRRIDDKYAADYTPYDFKRYAAHMQHPENEDYVVISGKHTFPSQRNAVFKKLFEMGYIDYSGAQKSIGKPGLVNLIPKSVQGRVDFTRRNINIR